MAPETFLSLKTLKCLPESSFKTTAKRLINEITYCLKNLRTGHGQINFFMLLYKFVLFVKIERSRKSLNSVKVK